MKDTQHPWPPALLLQSASKRNMVVSRGQLRGTIRTWFQKPWLRSIKRFLTVCGKKHFWKPKHKFAKNKMMAVIRNRILLLTYSWYECCVECIIRKTKQYTCFTNTRISNQQQFKQQVICLLGHGRINAFRCQISLSKSRSVFNFLSPSKCYEQIRNFYQRLHLVHNINNYMQKNLKLSEHVRITKNILFMTFIMDRAYRKLLCSNIKLLHGEHVITQRTIFVHTAVL